MSETLLEAQTNTKRGARPINSGEALTNMEGRLVMLADAGSVEEVVLPNAVTDVCPFVVLEGGGEDENSTVLPLCCEQQVRIVAKGTGSAGDILALAAIDGTDDGKVRALPGTAGIYFSPGIAEEDFADGQFVKVRPLPRMVTVSAVWNVTNANGAIAALTSSATTTQAEFEALRDKCEIINDDLIALKTVLNAAGLTKNS